MVIQTVPIYLNKECFKFQAIATDHCEEFFDKILLQTWADGQTDTQG